MGSAATDEGSLASSLDCFWSLTRLSNEASESQKESSHEDLLGAPSGLQGMPKNSRDALEAPSGLLDKAPGLQGSKKGILLSTWKAS